ncbi:MAG TPA: hypothetical protein VMP08_08715 [Anaerolineae bacterium]|nr:hypothetical protein [Anaerolineae bacterium]
MNNLAYNSQQPEKVGAQVEEKLRKELSASAPLIYQIENGEAGSTSASSVLSDMGHALVGGKSERLFTLVFDLPASVAPRAAQLCANVNRQGVGSHVGLLLYSTKLDKPVKGEVALEAKGKFGGNVETAAKLNAKGDLLKRLGKFARTESEIGGLKLKIERLVRIVPQADDTLLVISTLGRTTGMGFDATLDAREFFDLATMVEAAL